MTRLAGQPGHALPQGRIVVSVVPDTRYIARAAETTNPDKASTPLSLARNRYDDLAARYARALGSRSAPFATITLDVPELVVIDGGLWERLFDIYAYHGWDGVRTVVESVRQMLPHSIPANSPWSAAWPFLTGTAWLLEVLVAQALIELELRCVTRMRSQLEVADRAISDAINYYGIVREVTEHERPVADGVTVTEEEEHFRFTNEVETEDLHAALSHAVDQRARYESQLQTVADIREAVRRLRAIAGRARAAGKPLSSEKQLSSELALKEAQAQQLEESATAMYTSLLAIIQRRSPLGLLALEGLAPGFKKAEMEQLLGPLLFRMQERVARLRSALARDRNLSRTVLGATQAERSLPSTRVRTPPGPELQLINAGIKKVADDPAWLVVIHEPTLHALVEAGEIPKDSWTYLVWGRFAIALTVRLEQKRAEEAAWRSFWQGFAKAASAASLALLVTPAFKLSPLLRGAAVVADLILLAHSISSTIAQLEALDELQNSTLVSSDAFSIEGLGRLGELGVFAQSALTGISQQVMIELVLLATGARWPIVKEALMLRGYVQDLETLLSDGG
jgi:hypothetical protein